MSHSLGSHKMHFALFQAYKSLLFYSVFVKHFMGRISNKFCFVVFSCGKIYFAVINMTFDRQKGEGRFCKSM